MAKHIKRNSNTEKNTKTTQQQQKLNKRVTAMIVNTITSNSAKHKKEKEKNK